MFLTELGRGTVAVAILGPTVVAACVDSGEPAGVSEAIDDRRRPLDDDADTTGADASDGDANVDEGALRWEQVSLGFVSAYVLVRGNSAAVVDTGTPGSAMDILRGLRALNAGWDAVDHVILTHLHGDHVGGLGEVLGLAPDAAAYAGEADVAGIDSPRALLPVNDGDEVFGLQILGTPGHTPGHISVLDADSGTVGRRRRAQRARTAPWRGRIHSSPTDMDAG